MPGRKIIDAAKAKGAMRAFFKRRDKPKRLQVINPGEAIYVGKNPAHIPASKNAVYSKANVEWVRVLGRVSMGKEFLVGGWGVLWWGEVKFLGKRQPKIAVIKSFRRKMTNTPANFEKILKRLEKSGVPHPKMEFFYQPNAKNELFRRFVVMQPFVEFLGGKVISKFAIKRGELLKRLDLTKPGDREITKQVLTYARALAQQGLVIGTGYDSKLRPRADVFNVIRGADGKRRVFIQDIDLLFLSGTDSERAWHISSEWILTVLSFYRKSNSPIVQQLIRELRAGESLDWDYV